MMMMTRMMMTMTMMVIMMMMVLMKNLRSAPSGKFSNCLLSILLLGAGLPSLIFSHLIIIKIIIMITYYTWGSKALAVKDYQKGILHKVVDLDL